MRLLWRHSGRLNFLKIIKKDRSYILADFVPTNDLDEIYVQDT